ncbi:YbcC family protein [Ascidiimonas sp. W6]|uniref:YbcC family protein n=1 Tax=Ascidiimonas meishanensis TaxID=3128903 RepID=UPI0030EDBB41
MSIQTLEQPHFLEHINGQQQAFLNTMRAACKKIAPVWPLENFVAVNPYLGLTDKKFENVAQELAATGGIQMTLPASFYLQKLKEGKISLDDIAKVLKKRKSAYDAPTFIKALEDNTAKVEETATFANVADIATQVTNKDWNRFVISRISTWAASYFDNGQAVWAAANQEEELFIAWKAEASIDRTPELSGLKNFRKLIKALPDNPVLATEFAIDRLGIPEKGIPLYLHRLLLSVGGWSAYAAQLDWNSELYGGKDGKLISFLAVLVCWEACLLESLDRSALYEKWSGACELLALANVQNQLNQSLTQKLILQEAFDLAAQRNIIHKFEQQTSSTEKATKEQAKAQAVFCIDVRSEVFRRNLEMVDSEIETLGFAGFFAFPIKYVPIGHEEGGAQCPVLLPTGPTILEEIADKATHKKVLETRILNRQVKQVWKSFKSGAITCFSYVSPVGLSYLPKLFTDSFGLTRPVPHPDHAGMSFSASKKKNITLETASFKNEITGIPLENQIEMAKNALNAMSLSDDFAKFVMITGHGSSIVNNPHATGYDCGACGGRSGESNAKVAAAVLNNTKVRAALQKEDIFIPVNTTFLACLHDTTTDEITIFNEYEVPEENKEALHSLKKSLTLAAQATRTERSLRLDSNLTQNIDKAVIGRSKDWSQVRPEWGLAGCGAFVVAPRERTKAIDLEGKSFLHSYNWKKDKDFSILELIMTAPMVVTSWISLQYYGSTVDNKNHGSGNKTLHNVTAGIGVLEGYSGDLRVGLPIQAVHDGENYQHEPLRLNVVIEAPIEAMNAIIEKHPSVKDLCDNGWLQLMALDEEGKVSHRYTGNLSWEKIQQNAA